jgi:hypothetical protein
MLFPEKNDFILNKHLISSKLLIPGILFSRYIYHFESDYRNVTGNFPPISKEYSKNIIVRNNIIKTSFDVLNILNFGFNSYVSISLLISEIKKIKNNPILRVNNLFLHLYVVSGLIHYTYQL